MAGIAVVFALLLLISFALSAPSTGQNVGRLSALMMSIVPLLVVITIAVFARVSEYINLRSGGHTAQQKSNSFGGQK